MRVFKVEFASETRRDWKTISARQESLDPENWDEMRALAHRMVDDAITYLEKVGERPVWQPVPEDIATRFEGPVPLKPAGAEAVYQEFLETIFPYPMGNIHPRFWGRYMGNGTVLGALADLCAREGLWFHVDGAIGAVAVLAQNIKGQLCGIERADSIALDLHKWMHMPSEAGCVLVRHNKEHRETFSLTPEYLERNTRGLAAGQFWFSDYGLQLSRQFRALKVWMSIKEHGLERFGRMMARNVEQAHYLGQLIENSPQMELLPPIGLDIVCFRFNPGGLDDQALDTLNREILIQLQEQGISAPSDTTLRNRLAA